MMVHQRKGWGHAAGAGAAFAFAFEAQARAAGLGRRPSRLSAPPPFGGLASLGRAAPGSCGVRPPGAAAWRAARDARADPRTLPPLSYQTMTAATAPTNESASAPTTPVKAGALLIDAPVALCASSASPAEADFAAALAPAAHTPSLAETGLRAALSTYGDSACMTVAFAELEPEHTRAGEAEFAGMLHTVLANAGATVMQWQDLLASEQYSAPLPKTIRRSVRAKIVAVNAFKVLRSVGIKAGPAFVPHTKFPLWRPATWTHRKVVPGVAFIGVGEVRSPKTVHPFDYVRSTR